MGTVMDAAPENWDISTVGGKGPAMALPLPSDDDADTVAGAGSASDVVFPSSPAVFSPVPAVSFTAGRTSSVTPSASAARTSDTTRRSMRSPRPDTASSTLGVELKRKAQMTNHTKRR